MSQPSRVKRLVDIGRRRGVRGVVEVLRQKAPTATIGRRKLSTRNLERLCAEHQTDGDVLVVHSEDVPFKTWFPNSTVISKRGHPPADVYCDDDYRDLAALTPESYEVVLCTGLLEHVTDPQRLLDDIRKLLRPGGKLVLSASAVFAFHEGPTNYFHFTPNGLRLLTEEWAETTITGSCGPYETIGILLQRINLQTEGRLPLRLTTELLSWCFRPLDRFLVKQYDSRHRIPEREIDSMMPSNLHLVAIN